MPDKSYPEGVTEMDHVNHDMKMGRFPNQSSVETFLKERAVLAAQERVAHLPAVKGGMSDDIYDRALARATERLDEEMAREGFPPSAQYLIQIGVSEGVRVAALAAAVREGQHKVELLDAQQRVREADLYAIDGLIPVQQPHHIGPGWGHYVQALREAEAAVRCAPYKIRNPA